MTIIRGTGPETSGRYGDYFSATVDPSNPLVVWGGGQYGTKNGWATCIVSISIPTTFLKVMSYSVIVVIGGLLAAIVVLVVVVMVTLRRGRSLRGS